MKRMLVTKNESQVNDEQHTNISGIQDNFTLNSMHLIDMSYVAKGITIYKLSINQTHLQKPLPCIVNPCTHQTMVQLVQVPKLFAEICLNLEVLL